MIYAVTDLNCNPAICNSAKNFFAGSNHVFRQASVRATHGSSSAAYLSPDRQTIQRRIQSQIVFLSRSLSLYGLRATYLSRELARYRNVSTSAAVKALSLRHSFDRCPKYTRKCQCCARLAHLRRLRAEPDRDCSPTLQPRLIWRGSEKHSLCTRHHDHRPVFVSISLGAISLSKSGRQNAHAARLAWQYPELYTYQRRQTARGQRARSVATGSWCLLRYGSWLHRFCASFSLSRSGQLFRHSRQVKPQGTAPLLSPSRPQCGDHLRSNYCLHRLLFATRFRGTVTTNPFQRSRNGENTDLLDQQLYASSINRYRSISMPMAGRAVLQMDQTTPSDQSLFRDFRKRGEDPNLDCSLGLRLGCNPQKAFKYIIQPIRNSTDLESNSVRKSPAGSITYKIRALRNSTNIRKAAVFV